MHKLLLLSAALALGGIGATVGGKVAPDGKSEVMVDLAESQQSKNVGGSDGSGLCVFTSIGHAAKWQHVEALEDFQKWMTKHPGGGYPEKVTKCIAQICKEKNLPIPRYIQVEGGKEMLDVLKTALKSGLMVSTTYSFSPSGRYNGGKIAHMVNLVYLDDKYACILDNNYIGTKNLEWITTDEYFKSASGGRNLWAVILLDPGPPPPPWN